MKEIMRKFFVNLGWAARILITRRMIAFYVAAFVMYNKPEVSTDVVILAGFILGNAAIDSITDRVLSTKRKRSKIKELEIERRDTEAESMEDQDQDDENENEDEHRS